MARRAGLVLRVISTSGLNRCLIPMATQQTMQRLPENLACQIPHRDVDFDMLRSSKRFIWTLLPLTLSVILSSRPCGEWPKMEATLTACGCRKSQ